MLRVLMKEIHYIQKCLEKVNEKLQWEDFEEWTSYNFNTLSKNIFNETGISISSRTLRRIITNKNCGNPQLATKNALAQYIGFINWEEFKIDLNNNNNVHKYPTRYKYPPNATVKSPGYKRKLPWIILGFSIPIVIIMTILLYPIIQLRINKTLVDFRSTELVGSAPHTSSFFYDVTKLQASNIFIDRNFYDDEDGELVPIEKYRHFYQTTFTYPDYYAVKIIAGGERIKCIGIHVITKGWDLTVADKYFKNSNDDLINNGVLHIPIDTNYISKDFDYQKDFIKYKNIRSFDAKADKMIFKTKFRNIGYPHIDKNICKESKIELINKHGRISVTFVEPGCPKVLLNAEFGEHILNGEFDDLLQFYQDVGYWRNLEIRTKNRKITIKLDNVQIYQIGYKDVLDEMMGISFEFKGIGQVDYVEISNSMENLVFKDEFENVRDKKLLSTSKF
jgi:hypothetical protein